MFPLKNNASEKKPKEKSKVKPPEKKTPKRPPPPKNSNLKSRNESPRNSAVFRITKSQSPKSENITPYG